MTAQDNLDRFITDSVEDFEVPETYKARFNETLTAFGATATKKKWSSTKKLPIMLAAATLAFGGTAYAGTQIYYSLFVNQSNNYLFDIHPEGEIAALPDQIPEVKLGFSHMPENSYLVEMPKSDNQEDNGSYKVSFSTEYQDYRIALRGIEENIQQLVEIGGLSNSEKQELAASEELRIQRAKQLLVNPNPEDEFSYQSGENDQYVTLTAYPIDTDGTVHFRYTESSEEFTTESQLTGTFFMGDTKTDSPSYSVIPYQNYMIVMQSDNLSKEEAIALAKAIDVEILDTTVPKDKVEKWSDFRLYFTSEDEMTDEEKAQLAEEFGDTELEPVPVEGIPEYDEWYYPILQIDPSQREIDSGSLPAVKTGMTVAASSTPWPLGPHTTLGGEAEMASEEEYARLQQENTGQPIDTQVDSLEVFDSVNGVLDREIQEQGAWTYHTLPLNMPNSLSEEKHELPLVPLTLEEDQELHDITKITNADGTFSPIAGDVMADGDGVETSIHSIYHEDSQNMKCLHARIKMTNKGNKSIPVGDGCRLLPCRLLLLDDANGKQRLRSAAADYDYPNYSTWVEGVLSGSLWRVFLNIPSESSMKIVPDGGITRSNVQPTGDETAPLKPDETVTLDYYWLIDSSDLDKAYINITDGKYAFTDAVKEKGLLKVSDNL